MKAIAVVPGTRTVGFVDRREPSIVAPDDIKLRVLRVGICGTDREEAAGGRSKAPPASRTSSSATKCSARSWRSVAR